MLQRPDISRRGKCTCVSRVRLNLQSVMKIAGKYSQVSYIKATAKNVPRGGVIRRNIRGGGECQASTSTSCVGLFFIKYYYT